MTDRDEADARVWVEHGDIVARSLELFEFNALAVDRTLPALIAHVSELHGKPISISATTDDDWVTLTALWVDFPESAKIFYRAADTPLYQTHCILHELAHIIYRHHGCNVLAEDKNLEHYKGTEGIIRGRLVESSAEDMPRIEDAQRRIMEGEAEQLAHLLSSSLFRPRFRDDEDVFG